MSSYVPNTFEDRAAFRGGFKKRKRDGITTHHEFRALFLCDFSDAFRVFDKPEKVGLLDTYRADFVVDKRFKSVQISNAVFRRCKNNLDTVRHKISSDDRLVFRIKRVGQNRFRLCAHAH